MRPATFLFLATVVLLVSFCVPPALSAQPNVYCGDGNFECRQVACQSATCRDTFYQIVQPLGQGYVGWVQSYYDCCGDELPQWYSNGNCLIAGPQKQATLNPIDRGRHFLYVMTYKGRYKLLSLPGI